MLVWKLENHLFYAMFMLQILSLENSASLKKSAKDVRTRQYSVDDAGFYCMVEPKEKRSISYFIEGLKDPTMSGELVQAYVPFFGRHCFCFHYFFHIKYDFGFIMMYQTWLATKAVHVTISFAQSFRGMDVEVCNTTWRSSFDHWCCFCSALCTSFAHRGVRHLAQLLASTELPSNDDSKLFGASGDVHISARRPGRYAYYLKEVFFFAWSIELHHVVDFNRRRRQSVDCISTGHRGQMPCCGLALLDPRATAWLGGSFAIHLSHSCVFDLQSQRVSDSRNDWATAWKPEACSRRATCWPNCVGANRLSSSSTESRHPLALLHCSDMLSGFFGLPGVQFTVKRQDCMRLFATLVPRATVGIWRGSQSV